MKGTTIRLNEWETDTAKNLVKVINQKRRRMGQKDIKLSEVIHSILERQLPVYMASALADEEVTEQILML